MRYLHVQDNKMKFRNLLILGTAISMLVLPSCHKKDEDEEALPFLNGTLSFSVPAYVLPGESFTLVPSGASNPTTGNVGYVWYSSWLTARDTTKRETASGDGSWNVTMPLVIGTYTITSYAYATNYTPISSTKDVCVVDPTVDVSLTGTGYQIDSAAFKDPRDGATYYLATTGGKVWMQNNLYYPESGVSYFYSPAVDPIFGRLYTWDEALEACPDGWHLPSEAEFAALAGVEDDIPAMRGQTIPDVAGSLMANAYFLGDKLWAFWPNVTITNQTKFSAIPIGYAVDRDGSQTYNGQKSYAVFWTSDDEGDEAIYRYIYVDKNSLFSSKGDKKSFRASVRCVKD